MSEPQQICDEKTRYHPWKEPGFVLNAYVCDLRQEGVVAEWSARPSVNLATRVRFYDTPYLSFFIFLRGRVTEVRLWTPSPIVFSVAEWLALLRY